MNEQLIEQKQPLIEFENNDETFSQRLGPAMANSGPDGARRG